MVLCSTDDGEPRDGDGSSIKFTGQHNDGDRSFSLMSLDFAFRSEIDEEEYGGDEMKDTPTVVSWSATDGVAQASWYGVEFMQEARHLCCSSKEISS